MDEVVAWIMDGWGNKRNVWSKGLW